MLEALLEGTALPNLHPALVHFPIALAAAALLFDLAALALGRGAVKAALALWWLAAGSALAAYLAGRDAADGLGVLAPEVERAVALHSDWAWWTLLCLGGVALLRGLSATSRGGRPVAALGLAAGVGVQLLLVTTADLGGALVYRHGVAVAATQAAAASIPAAPTALPAEPDAAHPPDPTPPAPASLVTREDGSWIWTPQPMERSEMEHIVELQDPANLELSVLPGDGPGLLLDIAGEGALLLPGRFEGLRVVLDVETGTFEGTLGPAVLAPTGREGLALEWSGPDRLALVHVTDGEREQAAAKATGLPPGRLLLTLSAVDGHWKGYVGDESMVHAHGRLPGQLRPALVLRGTGQIRVHRAEATPLSAP